MLREVHGVPESDVQTLRQELAEARTRAERMEHALVESQRLATIGHLAAQMAHEFKNILMIIMGRAGYALSENDPALTQKALDTAVGCGQRGADIVKGILLYANGQQMESRVLPADRLMDQALGLIDWALPKYHVELVRQYDTSAPVRVVPVRMEQVLLNLILNARDAMHPRGGRLTALVEPDETPGYAALRIRDTGCGIPAEHLEQIFDPFFTTRSCGEAAGAAAGGTGLGLPVARDLVRQAGGEIHVDSVANQGSTFSVLLPVVDESD
jgi:signal transduction histidine kinase